MRRLVAFVVGCLGNKLRYPLLISLHPTPLGGFRQLRFTYLGVVVRTVYVRHLCTVHKSYLKVALAVLGRQKKFWEVVH